MRPTLVQFEAAGFGVGEVWLERGRVFHTELPRPRRTRPVSGARPGMTLVDLGVMGARDGRTQGAPIAELSARPRTPQRARTARPGDTDFISGRAPNTPDGSKGQELAERLIAFFAGEADEFADVRLRMPDDGFYADCARALRKVRRGEVVSYGELAVLAGYPGAARAAGTFCGRSSLSPFIPTHRVVGANGIGSYGDLGVEYKRRLLALEGVSV